MQRLSVRWLCAFPLILGSLYVPPAGPQAIKASAQLNPVSPRAQTGQQAQQAKANFPPECDKLIIRPGLDDQSFDVEYKLVDDWAHAIETEDWPTFHKLLPDTARHVFKGDDIVACADAAALNRSFEGEVIAFGALMYNHKWIQAMRSYQDKEQKRTDDKFNELGMKYGELYKLLLAVSTAPTTQYPPPPPPILCTSTRIGDTVVTSCD